MKLRKSIAFLLLITLLATLVGCNNTGNGGESKMESEASKAKELIPSEKAASIWNADWADSTNGFADASTIYGMDFYKNGALSDEVSTEIGTNDCKYIFYGENNSRIVNPADGYEFTLPVTDFKTDYSLSALRSRYSNDNFMLTVTKENKNPYGNNENGWNIYYTEWLAKYLEDLNYLSVNNLRRTREKQETTELIEGYTVTTFNMEFRVKTEYKYRNYDIAIIRKNNEYVEFYLFVMKSTSKQLDTFDKIIKSFKEIKDQGTARNDQKPYEVLIPDYWNDETKAYYEQLQKQTNVSWGAFSASMPEDSDSTVESKLTEIKNDQARLETAFDYKFDILPTYTPIGWYDNLIDFPSKIAGELAGGNGFNGKPVLQFTYQFTKSNNGNLGTTTPMFDILDGVYDDQFHKIAQQIKAYGKPVLFRLNNEMNTDWTSYCGMVTLLDPDIFVETWHRLYNIFREENVDNCMWIFNPIAKSCPYSSWGDYLCYMPGNEYMQLLGLTYYEMNNGTAVTSFKDMYTEYYIKNTPYFSNYPWIISEFACGAGGDTYYDYGKKENVMTEKGRNVALQTKWVEDMFTSLNNNQDAQNAFCKNIKAAIWFSVNDSTEINGTEYIVNYLQLNDALTSTLEAFKKGLSAQPK